MNGRRCIFQDITDEHARHNLLLAGACFLIVLVATGLTFNSFVGILLMLPYRISPLITGLTTNIEELSGYLADSTLM